MGLVNSTKMSISLFEVRSFLTIDPNSPMCVYDILKPNEVLLVSACFVCKTNCPYYKVKNLLKLVKWTLEFYLCTNRKNN